MIALQQQKQPIINNKALAWTIGTHALLLLLFFFIKYTILPLPPAPVVDGGGLEVNLGSSENGTGKDQPMHKKNPGAYSATVVYKNVTAKSALPEKIMKTTQTDAPEVNTPSKKTGKVHDDDNKQVTRKPEKPKYTYGGDTGPGGNNANQNKNGTGEGVTGKPGDEGKPGGTPGAGAYSGTAGNGSGGIGHTLSGRKIYPEKFEAEFRESGKVVIHVTVDRNGNIVYKQVKSTSNAQLTKIALEKLNDARFSKSDGSEPEQSGDVTIIFKTRQ